MKTDDRLIGIVQSCNDGVVENGVIGCAGRIVGFSETDDGRYMITLTGVSRFSVSSVQESFKPYLVAEPNWTEFKRDLGEIEHDLSFPRETFLPLLKKYFNMQELETDWDSLANASEELLINSLSMLCPFEPNEKQLLLEADSLESRRKTLQTLIEMALHAGPKKELIQ